MRDLEKSPDSGDLGEEMTPEEIQKQAEIAKEMWKTKFESEKKQATEPALEVVEQAGTVLGTAELTLMRRGEEKGVEVINRMSRLLQALANFADRGSSPESRISREGLEELERILEDTEDKVRGINT